MTISQNCQYAICFVFFSMWAAQCAHAVDFDNGDINNISSPLLISGSGSIQDARVFDSTDGSTTTLNALTGAEINGIDSYNTSIINVYDGSLITSEIRALDQSLFNVFGGTLANANAEGSSELNISGGSFTYSSGRVVGSFGDAVVNITGGVFTSENINTYSLLSNGDSIINVYNGSFNQEVRSNNTSMINIWGGSGITDVTATSQSIIKIYGLDFNIDTIGAISLDTPFVISDETYNGDLLTGTLLNGTTISADIFNGTSGSQIVLMQAVPLPAALWLFGSGLLGLIGISQTKRSH